MPGCGEKIRFEAAKSTRLDPVHKSPTRNREQDSKRLPGALQASGVATLSILKERKETAYPWLEATNRRIAESINNFCETEVGSRLAERSLSSFMSTLTV